MPKPSRPSASSRSAAPRKVAVQQTASSEPPPLVSARWLVSAIVLAFLGAALCAYGALCLLFYQGQWQMLFHPSRSITATPATVGLAYRDVRFDVTNEGVPRLDAWWVPSSTQSGQPSPWAADTFLYLHGSRGSLSDTVPALARLHALGLNVFAIDYQGYGHSVGRHPTERLLDDDSVAAWKYLTVSRNIRPQHIVVYGDGVGATLTARIAARFSPAAIVLQDPNPPARKIFLDDARARLLPLFLLQKEFLDPAADLARSRVPRLFLDAHPAPARSVITGPLTPAFITPAGPDTRAHQLFAISSPPKQYFDLRSSPPANLTTTVRRFLDEYLH